MDAPLTIRLFGPLEVRVGAHPLPPLRTRRGLYLLALLTLRHGRKVERAWVAETLWPDSRSEVALANLRRALTDLRRALGPEARRIETPSQNTLRFCAQGADIDVIAFDEAIARGEDEDREAAVACYGGTLLEGCYDDWALTEQQRREEAYDSARTALAQQATRRGNHAEAARHWKALTVLDPLREAAWRGWMQALADTGSVAAALEVYRQLREVLRREMSGVPAPETTNLYQALQGRLPTPEQISLTTDTERVFPIPPAGYLPAPPTRFIGRAAEVAEIVSRLQEERLLTIIGPGGIGKTRLALQVGETLRAGLEDGVWFVDLAPLADLSQVPGAIARLFGVREVPGETLLDTLACHLVGRRLLLILDNCEHLVPACADVTGRLLSSYPHLHVLATSRQTLGLSGEAVFPLHALPDAEAAELFARRARAARTDFKLTSENAAAVAEVCRRLDGIPLALELAAARMGVLSLGDIADRLADRFLLLTRSGGGRGVPERHRTLRATLDWSWDLLTDAERDLLCRLSVFAGGATLSAARAVAFPAPTSEFEALDALQSLIGRSLLFTESCAAGSEDSPLRYRMLETVREYTRQRADGTLLQEAAKRHLEWMLTLARPHYKNQVAWLESLETERDNLCAALDFVQLLPERLEAGLHVAYWLCTYFITRGDVSEGRQRYSALLGKVADDDPERPGLLRCAGRIALAQGNPEEARGYFEEDLRLSTHPADVATTLNLLGSVSMEEGNLEEAQGLFERSRLLWHDLGDEEQAMGKVISLGIIRYKQGDLAEARRLIQEGTTYFWSIDNKLGLVSSLPYLAFIARDEKRFDEERAYYEEALALQQETGNRKGMAETHLLLGDWAQARGGLCLTSQRHYEEALALFQNAREPQSAVRCLLLLADGALAMCAREEAEARYRQALSLSRSLNRKSDISRSLVGLAQVAVSSCQWERAAHLLSVADALPLPEETAARDQCRAAIWVALGEEAFTKANAVGGSMTLEEAVTGRSNSGIVA